MNILSFHLRPKHFYSLAAPIVAIMTLASLCLLSFGFWQVFYNVPLDYQQLDAVRIMYIHVPSAWLSIIFYLILTMTSTIGFAFRNPLFHIIAKSTAVIGLHFTLITLITGSIWGKPMWGTYWVWDARLTSVAALALLYLVYLMVIKLYDESEQGYKMGSMIAVAGLINLPIIKFSVDLWNSLHQGASIFRKGGIAIDQAMIWPLPIIFLGLLCFAISLVVLSVYCDLIKMKLRHAA